MAYLKGGSLIDGNLYVEGGLRVKKITDSSGRPLPHLWDSESSVANCLVKFMDRQGALHSSNVTETFTSESVPVYSIIRTLNSLPLNKVEFHLNDNSVIFMELKENGLSIKINTGINKEAKEFILQPNAYIIPYSADQLITKSTVDILAGIDKNGYEVMPDEIPEEFVYNLETTKRTFKFNLTVGTGISDIYWKTNGDPSQTEDPQDWKHSTTDLQTRCKYGYKYQWYATPSEGYIYRGVKKPGSEDYYGYNAEHPYVELMSASGYEQLIEGELGEFTIKLKKGIGIATLHYVVNTDPLLPFPSPDNYISSSTDVNITCTNGKGFSWYAMPDIGYYIKEGTLYSKSNPYKTDELGVREPYEGTIYAKSDQIPITINRGNGLTHIYYCLEYTEGQENTWVENTIDEVININGTYNNTFAWYAIPHEGYSYSGIEGKGTSKENPVSFVIGETVEPISTGNATINSYQFKINKPERISKIYYRINSEATWKESTESIDTVCIYGENYAWYATPITGYSYEHSTEATAVTGIMTISGYTYTINNEDVIVNNYPFVVTKVDNTINTIHYKVNNAINWTDSLESVSTRCDYNKQYSRYVTPTLGYECEHSTEAEAVTGIMNIHGYSTNVSATPITYSISASENVTLSSSTYEFNPTQSQTLIATYSKSEYYCYQWTVEGCTCEPTFGASTTITIPAGHAGNISVIATACKVKTVTINNPKNSMSFYNIEGNLYTDSICTIKANTATQYEGNTFYYPEDLAPTARYIYNYGDGDYDDAYIQDCPEITRSFLAERFNDGSLIPCLQPEDDERFCWSIESNIPELPEKYYIIIIQSGVIAYAGSPDQTDTKDRQGKRLNTGGINI